MRINNYNSMHSLLLNQSKLKNGNLMKKSPAKSSVGDISQGKINNSIKKEEIRRKNSDGSDYISMTGGNGHLLDKEDFKTGYSWIDNFTFKRDSSGPYTKEELYHLNTLKLGLAQEQKVFDNQYEKGWISTKRQVDPNKYLDEDGYFANGFTASNMPKMKRREDLNNKINDLFSQNGIVISDKEEFKFIIDPYNQVIVSGDIDDAKKELMEKVLNENNMGKQLVATTSGIAYTKRRYTKIEYDKYQINSNLRRYTGMDLRDFENNGTTLVSKTDGRSILDIYCEAIDNDESVPDISKSHVKAEFSKTLKNVLNYGYENIKDVKFEIGYVSNKLYDIDAVRGYGVGQTKWYDDLLKSRGNMDEFNKYANEQFLMLEKYEKYNQL